MRDEAGTGQVGVGCVHADTHPHLPRFDMETTTSSPVYAVTATHFGAALLDTGETVMYEFASMHEAQQWYGQGRPDARLVRRDDLAPHERDAIDAVLA